MQANINIPVIIRQIGTFLDPPSLFTSIQICRTWNDVLFPFLWYAIDDSLYSWNRILLKFESQRWLDNFYEGGSTWLMAVFGRYRYLVRELRVQRREILDVVAGTQCCLQLWVLRIGKMQPLRSQAIEYEWMFDLSQEEQLEMVELRWQDAMEGGR
jgi:hypothetical protein